MLQELDQMGWVNKMLLLGSKEIIIEILNVDKKRGNLKEINRNHAK